MNRSELNKYLINDKKFWCMGTSLNIYFQRVLFKNNDEFYMKQKFNIEKNMVKIKLLDKLHAQELTRKIMVDSVLYKQKLLFSSDRFGNKSRKDLKQVLAKALEKNKYVICDYYYYTDKKCSQLSWKINIFLNL